MTHHPGCWRDPAHHACAVAEIGRLSTDRQHLADERSALRKEIAHLRAALNPEPQPCARCGGAGGYHADDGDGYADWMPCAAAWCDGGQIVGPVAEAAAEIAYLRARLADLIDTLDYAVGQGSIAPWPEDGESVRLPLGPQRTIYKCEGDGLPALTGEAAEYKANTIEWPTLSAGDTPTTAGNASLERLRLASAPCPHLETEYLASHRTTRCLACGATSGDAGRTWGES